MNRKRKGIRTVWSFLLVLILLFTLLPAASFADDVFTDEYGNTVQWWNFRNSQTNNAVTDRMTPTTDKEAWGKWSASFGTGWSSSPTTPVIVNDKLYIGVGSQVLEVDKETGAVLRESEKMPGSVGFAGQSPLYADGKIFINITSGRICAINISDMSLAWTTDNTNILKGQTVSPINYVKINGTGYVSTGTAMLAGGEGSLFCASTNDEDVTVDSEGNRIKALTWSFDPAQDDKENLEANNSVALGYYWTGAYVTENYLAIGSDNGSTMGDSVNDTAFYTLDPLTGEIIDSVYGIHGQVRSTTVFYEGSLYFSTKGAKIYKIPVDDEGHLGEPSYIDLSTQGAVAATATPVIYGGRIYLGVMGKGTQFGSDGGHGFMVVRDDKILSSSSYIYKITVPGYPQAGALLSDSHVSEDFDGDGTPDGRVYLYFTYNALPGGIFCTYDSPDQTEPAQLSMEESKIFVPASGQQNYCTSPIIVDTDSTLYFKNDSGRIFAVESNPAALSGLKLMEEDGRAVTLDQDFQAKISAYKGVVSTNASLVNLTLTLEDGVTAAVNGTAYSGTPMEIPLANETTDIEIETFKNGKTRTYLVTLNKASVDCELSALGSAINNAIPSESNQNTRVMSPDLTTEITDYTFDWISTGTGNKTPPADPATTKQMNLFLKTRSDKATVAVYPGENTNQLSSSLNEDGTIKKYAVAGSVYSERYPVYADDITKDSTALIVVTAEDGFTQKTYHITFNRRIVVTEVYLGKDSLLLQPGESEALEASVVPVNATDKTLTWTSSDESVAAVDDEGVVTALKEGSAVITAASSDGPSAACTVISGESLMIDGEAYFFPASGETEIPCYTHEKTEIEFVVHSAASSEVLINGEARTSMVWTDEYETSVITVQIRQNGEEEFRTLKVQLLDGHSLVYVDAKAATCEEDGCIAHWRCTGCGRLYADEAAKQPLTKEAVSLPALGHLWGDASYLWSEDNKEVTASHTCLNDPSHIETETVQTRARVVKEPTYEEYGETNYTAVFTNPAFEEQSKTVDDIPAIYRSASDVFVDVNPGDWYEADVDYVYNWRNAKHSRLMSGYQGQQVFGSTDNLVRAQFAVMLHRMADEPEAAYNPSAFTDVQDGWFYTTAVMWAKESGVIAGYNNGAFGVSDPITREQVATILYRYAKDYMKLDISAAYQAGDLSGYPDVGQVSGFAQEGMKWVNGAGIIKGTSKGLLNPQGCASRAEIAAMFQRFIHYMETL